MESGNVGGLRMKGGIMRDWKDVCGEIVFHVESHAVQLEFMLYFNYVASV